MILFNVMKDQKKILLLGLPSALAFALEEQLAPQEFLVAREAGEGAFDLAVCGEGGVPPPGCPALKARTAAPLRLGALLREAARILSEPSLYLDDIALGPWVFRPQDRVLLKDGREVALTDRETDMLVYLARTGGRAASREELLRHVWQYQDGVDTHTLETHVYRLRQKTGEDVIVTDQGGYRLFTAVSGI
jgi:hypothetical protein